MLSGCFGDGINIGDSDGSEHWLPSVEERENLVYDNSDVFSRVSWNGTYGIDTVRSIYVSVPTIITNLTRQVWRSFNIDKRLCWSTQMGEREHT